MVLIGMVFSLLSFNSNWVLTNITYTEIESVQNFIRTHKLFGNYLTIYPDDGKDQGLTGKTGDRLYIDTLAAY